MATRLEMDRFNDLNRQGFMNTRSLKMKRPTKAEIKADAVKLVQADAEREAMYARWDAEDAA